MGIENRLERCDQHADPGRIRWLVERMLGGESFALVTDAGTPGVSDPGAVLVRAAAEAGVGVVPVPGPSALTAFLSAAGFERGSPVFRGFYPRTRAQRNEEWGRVSGLPFDSVLVWFESPERVVDALADLAGRAPEARAVVAKELTKRFEAFYRGNLKDLDSHIRSGDLGDAIRGEWVIGVELGAREASSGVSESSGDWEKALRSLLNCGVSPSRAAREVSQQFGVGKKPVYSRAVELAGDENERDHRGNSDDESSSD
jgi:16S rRNA (cytidine1402-2'-O)-methyltransferase